MDKKKANRDGKFRKVQHFIVFFFVSLVCAACGTEANMNARYFFAGCVLIFLLARSEWQN